MTQREKQVASTITLWVIFAAMTFMGLFSFFAAADSHRDFIPKLFIFLILWVSWVFMTVYVYRDANRRSQNGLLWALFVFFGHIFGLLVYLIVRSIAPTGTIISSPTCSRCQKPVQEDFAICPYCRNELRTTCLSCSRPLHLDWQVCPYCRHEITPNPMATSSSIALVPSPLSSLPVNT